ncbi:MmgE/PrpD family protein [Desulfocicer niacini]
MESILQKFSRFFNSIKFEDLPEEAINQAKLLTIDLLGVSIAGLQMTFPRIMIDYLSNIKGKPESTLLGTNTKIPAALAALGNGVIGHALDMDDGYRYGGVHAGISVIPAALACGELNNRSGKSFLLSVICGYEIVSRLAKAVNPSHLKRGFHTTGTIGVFGSTGAAGILFGLSEDEMLSALGMAGMQSAGLLEVLNDGGMMKPLQPGKAGMAGILSVEFAKRGAQGPSFILEGQKGLFKAMTDHVDTNDIFNELGDHYGILDQYVKFHAACRHTHAAVDGLLTLMKAHRLKFNDIENIQVKTYEAAINFCGKNTFPKTVEDAKFNLPYAIAMAAFFGELSNDHFNQDAIDNLHIQSFASRITVSVNEKWEKAYPALRGATVDVTTKENRFSLEVPLAKGEPENQATTDEIITKFTRNANAIKKEYLDDFLDILFNMEKFHIEDLSISMRRLFADQLRSL